MNISNISVCIAAKCLVEVTGVLYRVFVIRISIIVFRSTAITVYMVTSLISLLRVLVALVKITDNKADNQIDLFDNSNDYVFY